VKWFDKRFQDYQDTLNYFFPDYYVDVLSWNYDASVLLVHLFNDTDPGHIMIYDVKTKKQMFYISFSEEILQYQLSPTKVINFKTADNYELEVYLSLPVNNEGKSSPLIVMPHGGPFARDYWRYDPVVHYFNSKGFGVLKINFRGSSGYGKEHLLAGGKKNSYNND
jgi:dipeptidyl aminopeptidase/acylaminoacyl peptidase